MLDVSRIPWSSRGAASQMLRLPLGSGSPDAAAQLPSMSSRSGYAGGATTPVPAGTRPHVVISTKFKDPWLAISIKVKEGLERAGCTVYNPNTDNAELCRKMEIEEQVNDRWLLSFNENLEKVEATRGFVIQIQQGVQREKSFMQIAEEKMARWLKVPRIGIYSLETEKVVFPPDHFQTAKEKAQEQWAKKEIGPEVVMCSEIFEPLVEGQKLPVDKDGAITGKARGVDANGAVYEGDFVRHKREGRGKYTWPNGDTYEGEFAHHKIHGRGMYRYASGDVEVGSYEADEDTGVGVKRLADGSYWQLDAGKVVKKISEEEAKRLVKQHTLPSLW